MAEILPEIGNLEYRTIIQKVKKHMAKNKRHISTYALVTITNTKHTIIIAKIYIIE